MINDTSSEKLERIFEKYFQKSVELSVDNEIFKKGKFLLIENKILNNNYYFDFLLEKSKKIEVVKIPFPFLIEEHSDGLLYFDYRVKTLGKTLPSHRIHTMEKFPKDIGMLPSKLFNNILEFKFN